MDDSQTQRDQHPPSGILVPISQATTPLVEPRAEDAFEQHSSEYRRAIYDGAGRSALGAFQMGKALEGAHRLCEQRGRGAWKKWLAAYTPFLSKRTADRYRALYRRFACAEDVIQQYELDALHSYSRNDVPGWAFEQAVARAKNGEFISAEDARRLLSRKEDDVQSASF
ncbi:MAG: hypothetical protein KDB23_29040, partial [Planctomycetales bacterium]|nr:hypothetical protein [Planctomycetales bacterium]